MELEFTPKIKKVVKTFNLEQDQVQWLEQKYGRTAEVSSFIRSLIRRAMAEDQRKSDGDKN